MSILILGANGFIGSHLSEALLATTNASVIAVDLAQHNLDACMTHPRFQFFQKNMLTCKKDITDYIKRSDVVLPLVAIANPSAYVNNPLGVFELDFEANLDIVRQCVEFKKRIIFPSTSEVYGMCPDAAFDEDVSSLVTGPIQKERWIYSASKQLLDRVIYAYGKRQELDYTLFRPFNWYGPRLDNIFNPKPGASRVLTQFIGNILRGENIMLVDGGAQQRCFTHISDGISALVKIIENKNNAASQAIFNIGNPIANSSIRVLAEQLIALIATYPAYAALANRAQLVDVDANTYYGPGYQDVQLRVPSIQKIRAALDWHPLVGMEEGLRQTLDFYLK